MDQRSKIPGLALLALSFTHCTDRDPTGDPIVGDWRAIQVDGQKHPQNGPDGLSGEQLHIGAELEGDMTRYQSYEFDGLDYLVEAVADLVVDASAAPKYRLDIAHDFFDGDESDPGEPSVSGSGEPDTGYADTGAPDPGYDTTNDTGDYADASDDDLAAMRPLKLPTAPQLAPGAMIFDCTLEGDTLTCDREGAEDYKHWVFTRVRPDDEK